LALRIVVVEIAAHRARNLEIAARLHGFAQPTHVARVHQLQGVAFRKLALGLGVEPHAARQLGWVALDALAQLGQKFFRSWRALRLVDLDYYAQKTNAR
jgi:hypothetical protein